MSSGVDVLSVGLTVADHVCAPLPHMPEPGELVLAKDMIVSIGGGASNTGIDLVKMGVKVAIAASVGDDAFGKITRDILESHGIDTTALKVSKSQPTSQTLIVNVKGQDRRFIHLIGAYADFTAADIPMHLLLQCKVLFVGYLLMMPRLREDDLIPVFTAAREAGVKIFCDVATPGRPDDRARLAKILPYVDVFKPNDHEAFVILGERDPIKQAEIFHQMGATTVVVTMGGKGAVLIGDKDRLRAGIYPVRFVDPSGGGDAFDAGYIYGMLKGYDAEECLRYGTALGASCVRSIGTTPGVFTEAECRDFMQKNPLTIERL